MCLRPRSAFTLIELLVVISIIAILAAMLLPGVRLVKEQAQQGRCGSCQRQLATAVTAYATDWDGLMPRIKMAREDPTKSKMWFSAIAEYLGHDSDDSVGIANNRSGSVIWGCPGWRPSGAAFSTSRPGYGMNWYPDLPNSQITNFTWLDPGGGSNGYGIDIPLDRISAKPRRILFGDSLDWHLYLNPGTPSYFPGVWDPYRHHGRAVYAFFDGHVQPINGTAFAWRGCAMPQVASWNP